MVTASFTRFLLINITVLCCSVIAANAFTVQQDNSDICYKPGTWENCTLLNIVPSTGHDNCLSICKNTSSPCTHMTFSTGLCQTFAGTCGLQVNDTTCKTCQSSQKICPYISELKCEENYCCQGKTVKIFYDVLNSLDCLIHCTNFPTCQWFSYYSAAKTCVLMDSKGTPTQVGGSVCTSGQFGCSIDTNIICGQEKCCDGKPVEPQGLAENEQKCLEKCKALGPCKWFNYRTQGQDCFLLDSCQNPFAGACVSGQKECETGTTTPSGPATTLAPTVPPTRKTWLH
jgi:hypothetical protein